MVGWVDSRLRGNDCAGVHAAHDRWIQACAGMTVLAFTLLVTGGFPPALE